MAVREVVQARQSGARATWGTLRFVGGMARHLASVPLVAGLFPQKAKLTVIEVASPGTNL